MSEYPPLMPSYQDIDGFRIPGMFLPEAYNSALKYKPRADDVFVVTFPKSGTTWAQQILYLILKKGQHTENPLEFWSHTPFIEMLGVESAEQMSRPGTIKTHLPFRLVPYSKEAKYVYIVRNPKDTLVSFYHHTRNNLYMFVDGKFDDYFELFLNGETDYGDYFDNVLGWYEHRNDHNVLFMTYEELQKNTKGSILKMGKFLGQEYGDLLEKDEDVMNNVLEFSSFKYMKSTFNDSFEGMTDKLKSLGIDFASYPVYPGMAHIIQIMDKNLKKDNPKFEIVRKGIVGGWRNAFSDDQNRRMNEKIEKKLKGTEMYTYWKNIGCI